ncbi:ArsR/SmtB family transcription factor [Nocardia jiangxiensis]|uniref:ArsR/SmtB family transcription factor n=1 Tax=Nocardia jiangxiensis TaxID=282685 RepID=A0ABW6SDX0_9NOCA
MPGEIGCEDAISALSHHLKVLREAGLVRVSPEGSRRRHELRDEELESRYPGVLSSIIAASRSA